MNIKLKIVIAILLYCLALVLRLNGVFYDEPQTDEYLWLKRSKGVLIRLESDPLRATTHLGHPGIVPALVMAASEVLVPQVFSEDSNIGRQLHKSLFSARVACAIVASLAAPILFLGFFALIGFEASLLAALLLLFDPRFIGLSRIAHLDAILLVLSLISVVAYIHSELKRSTKLKLVAGVFWGLAVATKPTAVALIFVFIVFKAIRAAYSRDWQELRIRWSDIWAVVVGHLVMAAIYTRLWVHNSDYRWRLKIGFPLASDIYQIGRFFQEHYFVSIMVTLLLIALCLITARKLKGVKQLVETRFSLWLFMLIGFLILWIIPQVIENFMRFWKWTSGLSHQVHHSFNKVLPPPEGGYWLEFLSVLPELTLFGIGVSLVLLLIAALQANLKKLQYYFLAAAWIVIWLGLLSVSSKQSWRYAIPVMPAVAILAAGGLHCIYCFLMKFGRSSKYLLVKKVASIRGPWKGASLILLLVVLPNIWILSYWHPHYSEYFNRVTGSVSSALERGHVFNFIGEEEAYLFLRKQCLPGKTIKVALFGSATNMALIEKYRFTEKGPGCMLFGYFWPEQCDYALRFTSHHSLVPVIPWFQEFKRKKPVFEYEFDGVSLNQIISCKN